MTKSGEVDRTTFDHSKERSKIQQDKKKKTTKNKILKFRFQVT